MTWYTESNLVQKQNQKLSTGTGCGNTAELMPQTGTNRRHQHLGVPISRMWTQTPILLVINQLRNCEEVTETDCLCVTGPPCTDCCDLGGECDELALQNTNLLRFVVVYYNIITNVSWAYYSHVTQSVHVHLSPCFASI